MRCGECDTPALARGLCSRCYQRRRRAGTLPPIEKRGRPPPEEPALWESPLLDVLDALSPFSSPPPWPQVRASAELLDALGGVDLLPALHMAENGNLAPARRLALATLERAIR